MSNKATEERQKSEPLRRGGEENRRSMTDRVWACLEGGFMARLFSRQVFLWFMALFGFSLFQVYNRFEGMRKLRKIELLEQELVELRMNYVTISATLLGEQRYSSIEERLQAEGIELSTPKEPPIIVKK